MRSIAPPPEHPRARLLEEPVSVDACLDAVKHPGAGAVCVFVGCVRDHTLKDAPGGEARAPVAVVRLDYEAYAEMAEKVLAAIVREAEERWPGVRGFVQHRSGTLGIGELAVIVACSAPHRAKAFAACRHVIERLKEDAPIWKREHGEDGVSWVGLGP